MYFITFSISLLFIYASERNNSQKLKHTLMGIGLLIPSLLAGIRDYSVGNDVLLYGNGWFERACESASYFFYIEKAKEYSVGLGYATVNWAVSRISSNPHIFYFCYELIQLILLYFSLKPLKGKISVTFAYFIYYFLYYNLSLNILRQIMALLIVLFSYRFIIERKKVLFGITILIAYSFHSTAIVGLVLYPIAWAVENKQLKTFSKYTILGASVLLALSYSKLFSMLSGMGLLSTERYAHYLTDTEVGGRFVRIIYWMVICGIIIMRGRRYIKYENQSRVLEMYLLLSGVFSILSFIGSAWLIRVVYYFDIFQILFVPIMAKKLGVKFDRLKSGMGYIIFGLVVFTYWLITFILRNGAMTYPFVFMRS